MAEKKDLDSRTYRKLLEFIKEEGTEPIVKFLADYEAIKNGSLIFDALCDGRHPTLSLVRRNKAVANFIKGLDTTYHFPAFLFDCGFLEFVEKLLHDNISKQINGACRLEELGVEMIRLKTFSGGSDGGDTIICYGSDNQIIGNVKFYSNGAITYGECSTKELGQEMVFDSYYTDIKFPTDSGNFVLCVDSLGSRAGSISIVLNSFDFDLNLLPNKDELTFCKPPKSLVKSKVYINR